MARHLLATLALLLALAGCTAAPYQPSGIGGGYEETRLSGDD